MIEPNKIFRNTHPPLPRLRRAGDAIRTTIFSILTLLLCATASAQTGGNIPGVSPSTLGTTQTQTGGNAPGANLPIPDNITSTTVSPSAPSTVPGATMNQKVDVTVTGAEKPAASAPAKAESPIGGTGIGQAGTQMPPPAVGTASTQTQGQASQQTGAPSGSPHVPADNSKAAGGSPQPQVMKGLSGGEIIAPSAAGGAPSMDAKISLDLRDMDIMDVLKFLAIKGNLNIAGGKNITGTVSLLLNNVTVRDALDIILSTHRLAYSLRDNIMQVMTEEEYKALFGKQFYDKRETKIVKLVYASAKNIGAMLENVKSEVGRIVYDDSTGTVVLMDTPQKIREMEEVIRHEELPSVVRTPPTRAEVFSLQYAKAKSLAEKVTPVLTKEVGKIYVDETSNRLVVSDLPHALSEAKKIITAFDVKTREVFIEAKIIQITLSDQFQSGVDWARVFGSTFQATFPQVLGSYGQIMAGSIAVTETTDAAGVVKKTYSNTGAVIKFLETFGDARILSTPRIAAISDQEAKIMVGTKEAYTTSSVTQSQATTTTAQNVTFIDVGMTLFVTPHINEDGFITLKIRPEISSVQRWLTTSQGDQIPIVQTTNADTTVMVKDGATVLIGGLMQLARSEAHTGLPGLSRIPVAGNLFRSTNDRMLKQELVVLLTPHLMSGEEALPGTSPIPSASIEGELPSDTVAERDIAESTGRSESYQNKRSKGRRWRK